MKKYEISAAAIVQDFNRRGISPDWIHEVNQGYLRLWRINQNLISELYIGSDNGKSSPGTIKITGKLMYVNTLSPQSIADDLMLENELGEKELDTIGMMSPSEMGKIGGSSKSDAKAAASKENGKKGGRPKKIKEEPIER